MINLRYRIKAAGGWLRTVGKVAQILRCEGMLGLRRRLAKVVGPSSWDYSAYEILVVDNGLDDPQTLAYFNTIGSDPRLRILRDDHPFNYSALNNCAVHAARGELVGLINNDIEVICGEWLTEMVSIAPNYSPYSIAR